MTALTLNNTELTYGHAIDRHFYLAGIVLLVYDHLLTFKSEVQYIWTTGHTKASAWYLFVRYFALCANGAIFVLSCTNFTTKTCVTVIIFNDLLVAIQELIVGTTLIRRVLAMYLFDKRVRFVLIASALITIGLFIWALLSSGRPQVYRTSIPGCYTGTSSARSRRFAGAWEGTLVTDLLCLGFTLFRGYVNSRDGTELPRGSLWRVIIRDGIMYYVVICLAKLSNIMLYYFNGNIGNINLGLSAFTIALSVTVMCRLMLNLHEAASITNDLSGEILGSIHFARTTTQRPSVSGTTSAS